MISTIIHFAVRQKLIIGLLVIGLMLGGGYAVQQLPIDAVPDITNNQVQVVTTSPALAPQEMEQFVTYPVEVAMANIPNILEIRSISRFGLSVVTIVFEDHVPVLEARQFVREQIEQAKAEIPPDMGTPGLMPITTGLGEIYQYVLEVDPAYRHIYGPMELRTIQDWIVKRQLAGIEGIVEVSSFGGYLKQYEVAVEPDLLHAYDIALSEIFKALARNNQNSGGSYIEKGPHAYYIRTEGLITHLRDIENIVVANRGNTPILVKNLGTVQLGSPKRFGAMTMDGLGEAVGGITLMLKGANSSAAIRNVHERIEHVKQSLPPGVRIYPYLDRSDLVSEAIGTVRENLLLGGAIVMIVLFLLLGNWRAGLIVASVIPLALLFALICMRLFGVSANLMSLGAIDFGIVVDGAVIIVEGVLFALATRHAGQKLSQAEMDEVVAGASSRLFRTAIFGVFIILVVFIPVITLTGIEGKMFRPMALTFSFAILGALLLSLTYVPMMAAWILPKSIKEEKNFADRLVDALKTGYRPVLRGVLRLPGLAISLALFILGASLLLFARLGAEFIPTLEEGDLAMQMTIQPGSALEESIRTSTRAEQLLLKHFPEVEHVVSKIGTAEVPTDPMAVEDADIMIVLKDKAYWTTAKTREELVAKMKSKLSVLAGASFEFTQPIQLRFNELMTGAKTDIAVKIFGEDMTTLSRLAGEAARIINGIDGAGDVRVEQTEGLSQLVVTYDREKIALYGVDIAELNTIIRTAYAGEVAGVVFEQERKFDLVLRLAFDARQSIDLSRLYVHLQDDQQVPLSELATVAYREGPMQISRENARRRINVGVNVRGRDVASLVTEIQTRLHEQLVLPAGYQVGYGGDFENLRAARRQLSIAVPIALTLILFLLYLAFGNIRFALIIFSAVPMAAIGGIVALWLRGMPFSISAGVGFIALFGVAVLNGIVLISYFNELRRRFPDWAFRQVVIQGAQDRLRPVLTTATVAALGFLPMALSTSNGAEVQKPLATVVIGGLITATLLTLLLLPTIYYLVESRRWRGAKSLVIVLLALVCTAPSLAGQKVLDLPSLMDSSLQQQASIVTARLGIDAAVYRQGQARELPPLEVELGGGQFNTSRVDYMVNVRQSLGQPARDRRRRVVADAELERAQAEAVFAERALVRDIRSAWWAWQTARARLHLLVNQRERYNAMMENANSQLEVGEINALDQTLMAAQANQANLDAEAARLSEATRFNQLQRVSGLVGPFRPDTPIVALPLPDTLQPAAVFEQVAQKELALRAATIDLESASSAPEWALGYMNQSIRPNYSFQAVTVGATVPLFRKRMRAATDEARVALEISRRETLRARYVRERNQELLMEQARTLDHQLSREGVALRRQAKRLRNLASQQLELGETDYFRYLQAMELATRYELEYLDLLEQYNQTIIDLEYYLN